jgi:2-polyprenyl-6-methoxyphenol hydroxylase-like FAD-dependent oxidoreductase
MEDAAALGRALTSCTPADLPQALEAYEQSRRPAVQTLQDAAARSSAWFEDVDRRIGLAPRDFGFSLRMRRHPAERDGAARSAALWGLHRVTQWPLGRRLRRVVATRRRAAQRRRADEPPTSTPEVAHEEEQAIL